MQDVDKIRENRLRAKAARMGLSVVKSRRRDPQALDFGLYYIKSTRENYHVIGHGPFGPEMSLDDIENYLIS